MGTIPAYRKGKGSAGWCWALVAGFLLAVTAAAAQAQAPSAQDMGGQKLTLIQPLDGATVRETVPIRMSRSVLPVGGYVAILVDGVFRTARAVPAAGDLIYDWDTKEGYTTPDDPDQQQFIADGPHDILVQLYDHDGNLIGTAEAHVKVANKIHSLPDGVHLVYQWRLDEMQRYHYVSSLSHDQSDSGGDKQALQQVDLKFNRSVEDATGGDYLLRDLVQPNGFIGGQGGPTLIQTAYDLRSRYRTVNRYGEVLVNNAPFSPGDHFGFPIPQFPSRRVNVGDSWESHMEVSLGWNSVHPTMITGTAKLDSFEWQNGYPTAKIIETYEGPATFRLNDTPAANQTAAKPVDASDVEITRTIWFAYNSGRLIRMETNMTVTAPMSSDQIASLEISGSPSGAIAGGREGVPPAAAAAAGTNYSFGGPRYNVPMGPPAGMRFGPPPGYPGAGYPGAGYPGRPPVASPQQAAPQAPTKLVVHDVTSLIGVQL